MDNLVRIPENNGTFSDHVVLTSLLIGYMVRFKQSHTHLSSNSHVKSFGLRLSHALGDSHVLSKSLNWFKVLLESMGI